MTLCFEAQALASVHRFDDASACVTEALKLVEETDERWWEAEVHRVRGEIMTACGDFSSGEASFRKAIEIAAKQNTRLLKLRSVMSLGRLLSRETARREEARVLVAAVYNDITEHSNVPDLVEANAFLVNSRASGT